jgi:hypothetical protein
MAVRRRYFGCGRKGIEVCYSVLRKASIEWSMAVN